MIHLQQPPEEPKTRRRSFFASLSALRLEGVREEVLGDLGHLVDARDDTEQSQRARLRIRSRQAIDTDLQTLLTAHLLVCLLGPIATGTISRRRSRGGWCLQLATEQSHELQGHGGLAEEERVFLLQEVAEDLAEGTAEVAVEVAVEGVVVEVVERMLMVMVVVQEAVRVVRWTVVAVVEARVVEVEVVRVVRIVMPREVDAQQCAAQTLEGLQQRPLSLLVLDLVLRLVLRLLLR